MRLCPQLGRLSADHGRWGEAMARLAEGDDVRAARLLELWDGEIHPRLLAEEEVLLPELTSRLSEADALVVFALGDHAVLRRLARALRAAVGPEQRAATDRLAAKLEQHFAFEDGTLFPSIQETLGCARLGELAGELTRAGEVSKHRRLDGPAAAHATSARRKGKKP